jgi:hypothetical protein
MERDRSPQIAEKDLPDAQTLLGCDWAAKFADETHPDIEQRRRLHLSSMKTVAIVHYSPMKKLLSAKY